jgi:hypothetical protein
MRHVTIVVPECDVNVNSIGDAHEILSRANAYWKKIGNSSKLDIQIAGFISQVRHKTTTFQCIRLTLERSR